MTPEEADYEYLRSLMLLEHFATGVPVDVDPMVLDRAAAAFRAAEPSAQARKRRTATTRCGTSTHQGRRREGTA